ncbi:hypothetical protein [Sphingomonas sp.]|uniref:hypothetical protein n=1 Tax=Sphingomonas sp. TaxID=28214 RepID=UPI0025DD4D61|nr:hypothetical protein [Sphingomonas sp.]
MRTSTIFKNRWMALIWAAGILWGAYDVAAEQPQGKPGDGNVAARNDDANSTGPDAPTDATGAPISREDQQKLADAINGL